VKVTEAACRRFRRLADEQGVTLGALFEQAVEALERQRDRCEPPAVRRHLHRSNGQAHQRPPLRVLQQCSEEP
jgi:hypothetical protein